MQKIKRKVFVNILFCSIGFVNRCLSHRKCDDKCLLYVNPEKGEPLRTEHICFGKSYFIRALAIDLHLERLNDGSNDYECVRSCEECKYQNKDAIDSGDDDDYCLISRTFCKMLNDRPGQEVKK